VTRRTPRSSDGAECDHLRAGRRALRSGHLWVYRSDVRSVEAAGGDTVRVVDSRGRTVGRAFYSDRSQIALRLLTRGDEPAGPLLRRRIESAIALRGRLGIDGTACRLVHGEGDLLPSIVVDRYGDYLVVQALSQGADRLLPDLVAMLVDLVQPAGILARTTSRYGGSKGWTSGSTCCTGRCPRRSRCERAR